MIGPVKANHEKGNAMRYTVKWIKEPGKFEGEPDYIPYYWDLRLSGGGDETLYDDDDVPIELFRLGPDDPPVQCGHAKAGDILILQETRQGFVGHAIIDADQADEWRSTFEQ